MRDVVPKIGLALSGGGARCLAQLGVMRYLEEKGVEIAAISGSSGGAIIAGLYAGGMDTMSILQTLKEVHFKKHLKYAFKEGVVCQLRGAISDFWEIFGKKEISTFKVPLFITLVDYESGKESYMTQGDMVTLMMASSALVPFFAPVMIEERYYIDGGFCDNLPSHPLRPLCDIVIGINVNPVPSKLQFSFLGHIRKALMIMLHTNIRAGQKECDLFIEIAQMGRYSIFDLKNFDLFFKIGYDEAKKYEKTIEGLL